MSVKEASSSARRSESRSVASVTGEPEIHQAIGSEGRGHGSKPETPLMAHPFPKVVKQSPSGQAAQTGQRRWRGAGCYSSLKRVLATGWL